MSVSAVRDKVSAIHNPTHSCDWTIRFLLLPCLTQHAIKHPSVLLRSVTFSALYTCMQRSSQGGLKGLKPPVSDQNIDVYFLSFSPTLYCKSRSGTLQNVLWQYHRRSNTFVIKLSGYEFSRFEKYWSSFLHSCVLCTTIYNKSWVLPCSASVETSMTFELPTVSIDV